jgi:hypothetical protein
MPEKPDAKREPKDPGYARVRDFLLFGVSLPERTLRSASGVVSGALRESASLLVPQAFRNSKTYNVMIQQMLDFLAEDVGGVERVEDPDGPPKIENYVARKAVGNFVEMAGLKELAGELKQQGVIDQDSTVDDVDGLLEAVARAARTTAGAFDTPPLSVDGLKQTIAQTRQAVGAIDPAKIIPQSEVRRLWDEIHQTATGQGVNPLAVSSAMTLYSLGKIGSLGRGALSTVRAAGILLDRHVIDHYGAALGDIRSKGIYASLAQNSRPYIDAVWLNFSTDKTTITEDVLSGRLIGRSWGAVRRWLGGGQQEAQPDGEADGAGQ